MRAIEREEGWGGELIRNKSEKEIKIEVSMGLQTNTEMLLVTKHHHLSQGSKLATMFRLHALPVTSVTYQDDASVFTPSHYHRL